MAPAQGGWTAAGWETPPGSPVDESPGSQYSLALAEWEEYSFRLSLEGEEETERDDLLTLKRRPPLTPGKGTQGGKNKFALWWAPLETNPLCISLQLPRGAGWVHTAQVEQAEEAWRADLMMFEAWFAREMYTDFDRLSHTAEEAFSKGGAPELEKWQANHRKWGFPVPEIPRELVLRRMATASSPWDFLQFAHSDPGCL